MESIKEFLDTFQYDGPPDRIEIYRTVANHFEIRTALYPGSAMDVAPSLFIPQVVYLDNFSLIAEKFEDIEGIKRLINVHKAYSNPCDILFYAADYHYPPNLPQFDLLISQYAGNIGQVMKRFLKKDGILLVAEGPEDAKLAFAGTDYDLVGTIKQDDSDAQIVPGVLPVVYDTIYIEDDGEPPYPVTVPRSRNFCFRKVR